MPSPSSVNLSNLAQNKTGAALALINLARFANGPLRLRDEVENGVRVTYLGVRSWPTYFFEKIIAMPSERRKAKLETQKAIDQHVRSFLNNSGITLGCSTEALVAELQSRVVKRSVLPDPVGETGTGGNGKSGSPAKNSGTEAVETKSRLFRGSGTVPRGLSVAVVPPLKMIADVRLVTRATYEQHPKTDSSRGLTYPVSDVPDSSKKVGTNDWKKYYLDNLSLFASVIQTSVVMELQTDSKGNCSESNLEGANAAAKEFVGRQKLQGKQVSIMLTVPKLPTVNGSDSLPGNQKGSTTGHPVLVGENSSSGNADDSSSE